MENNSFPTTAYSDIYGRDALVKIFLVVLLIIEYFVLFLILSESYKIFLVMILFVGVILIVLKPHYGLFISTVLAYSGIATQQLQGLFLPAILLTAFAWIVTFLNNKGDSFVNAAQNQLFILFGLLMIFSTFYASDIENSLKDMYVFLKYLIFYFLMINMLKSWKLVRNMIWVLTITGLLMFFYGVLNYFFSGVTASGFRLISLVDDPNSFAIKLVPLVAFSYILIKTEKSIALRVISFLLFGSIATAIILTFSRGGMLALFMVLLLISLVEIKSKRTIFIIASFMLFVLLMIPEEIFFFRFQRMDVSIIQRLKLLKGGLNMFFDHPFLGVGVGNFVTHIKDYSNIIVALVAHNSYLHIAAELGIIGLILFISIFAITIKNLWECWKHLLKSDKTKNYYYPLGILIALSGFMVHSLFLSEQYNIVLFIIVALTVVINKLITPLQQ
jgi:O-antigen ligase